MEKTRQITWGRGLNHRDHEVQVLKYSLVDSSFCCVIELLNVWWTGHVLYIFE